MTVLMVVATVNSSGQIESKPDSKVLVEQASKDHAATVAEALPKEGVVVVQNDCRCTYFYLTDGLGTGYCFDLSCCLACADIRQYSARRTSLIAKANILCGAG